MNLDGLIPLPLRLWYLRREIARLKAERDYHRRVANAHIQRAVAETEELIDRQRELAYLEDGLPVPEVAR